MRHKRFLEVRTSSLVRLASDTPPVPVSQSRMAAGFDAAGFPRTPTASAGMEYVLPDGSLVRVMAPSGNAPRRASFTNANGGPNQPLHRQAGPTARPAGLEHEGLGARAHPRGADAMSPATRAFDDLLPTRIDRAEIEAPTLLLGGLTWSLSATCEWRWVKADGTVVSSSTDGAEDLVWDLVGDEIVAARWAGLSALGADPSSTLKSGGALELFSDASFDTWVLHTPELVLVGPLRES